MSQWVKLTPTRHQVAIAGVVSDAQTGALMAQALVEMVQMPASFQQRLALQALQHGHQWATLSKRPDRVYTARDGTFYFVDLPNGDYTLQVSLPNAGTRYQTAQTVAQVTRDGDQVQRATVAIALPPTALKGTIKNYLDSEPIFMATVRVAGINASTLSNSAGQYLMTGLEVWMRSSESLADQTPKPLVTVSAPGYQPVSQGLWLSQGEVTTLDFTLTKKASA